MPAKRSKLGGGASIPSRSQPADPKTRKDEMNNADRKQKALKPLLLVSKPPVFDLHGKGKVKAKPEAEVISLLDDFDEANTSGDDRLWVDTYEPQSEAELAVHKRKVEDVRRWFQEAFDGGPAGKLKKYRRILVLTGPAGTAKTTTIRVLSKELGFDILEWRNSLEENYQEGNYERESLNQKFETFLARAATCRQLLSGPSYPSSTSSQILQPTRSSSSDPTSRLSQDRRQVILLEDLPNILHHPTQEMFHNAIKSFVTSTQGVPLVLVISDASTRGETRDEKLAQGGNSRWSTRDTIDIRTVFPPSLISGPFVTQVVFNPIAPTLMLRALQEVLARCSRSDAPQNYRPTKEDLNIIVETSNGDIRSAIMALQFACVLGDSKSGTRGKKKGNRALMEAVTRREQALALFHLMGKVLYNKRKGDPLSATASAKEKRREQELDAYLRGPPPLPRWLTNHERRPSRVDVDTLYSESPIDAGLFGLYIHQNYTQFCDDIEQCSDLSDWLSWIDSSGGEQWYQTNPHQFHLLALGTLHSLPSPVTRRGQKMYKPEYFDASKKSRDADDAVLDAWSWLQDLGSVRWSRDEIATELGTILKRWTVGGVSGIPKDVISPPPSHLAFSSLTFSKLDPLKASTLDVDGGDEVETPVDDEISHRLMGKQSREEVHGDGWLTDDDIEDF